MSTKYKLPKYKLNTNYYITKEITNISTRITCPAQEIRSYVLFPWDVLHPKGVYLDYHCPPKHSIILVCCIL